MVGLQLKNLVVSLRQGTKFPVSRVSNISILGAWGGMFLKKYIICADHPFASKSTEVDTRRLAWMAGFFPWLSLGILT